MLTVPKLVSVMAIDALLPQTQCQRCAEGLHTPHSEDHFIIVMQQLKMILQYGLTQLNIARL